MVIQEGEKLLWRKRYRDQWLQVEDLGEGVTRLLLSSRNSRLLGFVSTPYLLGGVLIDTSFAHVRELLVSTLAQQRLAWIACTHHHEDHTANAGLLAEKHRCPVYMYRAHARWSEGVNQMPLYRQLYWGYPVNYQPQEMPPWLEGKGVRLRRILAPGHSQTQVTLFDEERGVAFSGDLYITGGASAVMAHENPYLSIESLRRVASLEPSRLLTGHGGILKKPAAALHTKAERIEEAASRAVELHHKGLPPRQIVRRLFPKGRARDRFFEWMTSGEFSRLNFVQACLRHRQGGHPPT